MSGDFSGISSFTVLGDYRKIFLGRKCYVIAIPDGRELMFAERWFPMLLFPLVVLSAIYLSDLFESGCIGRDLGGFLVPFLGLLGFVALYSTAVRINVYDYGERNKLLFSLVPGRMLFFPPAAFRVLDANGRQVGRIGGCGRFRLLKSYRCLRDISGAVVMTAEANRAIIGTKIYALRNGSGDKSMGEIGKDLFFGEYRASLDREAAGELDWRLRVGLALALYDRDNPDYHYGAGGL